MPFRRKVFCGACLSFHLDGHAKPAKKDVLPPKRKPLRPRTPCSLSSANKRAQACANACFGRLGPFASLQECQRELVLVGILETFFVTKPLSEFQPDSNFSYP